MNGVPEISNFQKWTRVVISMNSNMIEVAGEYLITVDPIAGYLRSVCYV